jgi:hypothetical protein
MAGAAAGLSLIDCETLDGANQELAWPAPSSVY